MKITFLSEMPISYSMSIIRLSPVECAYIAACQMPPSFEEISRAAKNKLPFPLEVEKVSPNSMLFKAISKGYGNKLPLRDYFEGMDENSHNLQLFEQYRQVLPRLKEKNISAFREIVREIDLCSVKVGRFGNGEFLVYFPSGKRKAPIRLDYLPDLVSHGDFISIHYDYAIRQLEDKVIDRLKKLPDIWSGVLK